METKAPIMTGASQGRTNACQKKSESLVVTNAQISTFVD
jgi:hypothetical protein